MNDLAIETEERNKKLERKKIVNSSISSEIFEELFNIDMLGSSWLKYEQVKQLYKDHNILERDDHFKLYVQEL